MRRSRYRLTEWSKAWLLRFNADKCKSMHLGLTRGREHIVYNLRTDQGCEDLEIVANEKGLGVIMTNDLKSSIQCAAAARKAKCCEVNERFIQVNYQGKFHNPIPHICQIPLGILHPSMEKIYLRKDIDLLKKV